MKSANLDQEQDIQTQIQKQTKRVSLSLRQEQEQLQEYSHLQRIYKVKIVRDLKRVGNWLGYNSFLSKDRTLNLSQKYQMRKFGNVLKSCNEIHVSALIISKNRLPRMVEELVIPIFPQLITLDLSQNQISSIEPLSNLYAPSLQLLNLEGNLITNIKLIKRFMFPNLIYLYLNCNFYNQLPEVMPGFEVELDRKVIERKQIYKSLLTKNQIGQRGGGKLLNDYFIL